MVILDGGVKVENPSTVRYAHYDPQFWEMFVTNPSDAGAKDYLTAVNGETIKILHDPTLEGDDSPRRGRKPKSEHETE